MRIDAELKALIPPLSDEEFEQLKKNIMEYGLRDPLVVAVYPGSDGEVLIDGHNRYKICTDLGRTSFPTKRIDFDSRDSAMAWMIENQLGRRNLEAIDRITLHQKKHEITAKKAKENSLNNLMKGNSRVVQMDKSEEPINTREAIAKDAGVGTGTVARVEFIQKHAPEKIEKVRSGEYSINQAYKETLKEIVPTSNQKEKAIKRAISEHMELKESRVVSIDDVKKDKENMDVIAHKFMIDILSASSKIDGMLVGIPATAEECIRVLNDEEKEMIRLSLVRCESEISLVIDML